MAVFDVAVTKKLHFKYFFLKWMMHLLYDGES